MERRPVSKLSVSPRSPDQATFFFNIEMEMIGGLEGGFTDVLDGTQGYCMVHLFGNGFRYVSFPFVRQNKIDHMYVS